MENKFSWLSLSIFYKKANWCVLLKSLIYPYINYLQQDQKLFSFRIEFNTEGGENIRMPLLVLTARADEIAKETDEHINSYFIAEGKFPEYFNATSNCIFMPFPENTTQYGLYRLSNESEISIKSQRFTFQQILSETIIKAISESELIDDEMILTLAFYMELIYLKIKPNDVDFDILNIGEKVNITQSQLNLINNEYEKSYKFLQEIDTQIEEFIKKDFCDLNWLLCYKNYLKFLKNSQDNNLGINFLYINNIIIKQLNLSVFAERLLNKFIYEIIKDKNSKSIDFESR